MENFLAIVTLFFFRRTVLCVVVAGVCVIWLNHAIAGFTYHWGIAILAASLGLGIAWEACRFSETPGVAAAPPAPLSKPTTFLGLAFIGIFWGGFAGQLLGSVWAGGLLMVAMVACVAAWNTLVRKRKVDLGYQAFVCVSLLSGLAIVYALFVPVTG